MIQNYIMIAWRSLWKYKTASIINIAGLSISLACCLLMIIFINHELSYDRFQENGDRIVRVIMEYSFDGGEVNKGNYTSSKVAPAFKRNFPEVVAGVRMQNDGARLVRIGDKSFNERKFIYADSSFFSIFSFKLLNGNPKEVLKNPNCVVISASTAAKYFGNDNPIGKIIKVGSNSLNYTVTGVASDCPSNSQIKFDFLASLSSLDGLQENTYFDANYTTYLLLSDSDAIKGLQAKIQPFMQKELKGEKGVYIDYELEPYYRIHLHSPYDGFEPNNNINYIYIIASITLLVLIIACLTFINLSTSRSINRAKEVGIRKVSGAVRKQIFFQFLTESFIITTVSLFFSYILANSLLPFFNSLSGKNFNTSELFHPTILLSAFIINTIIAFFAGSYPALLLSGLNPVAVLKGSYKGSIRGLKIRQSLIIFQFAISIILILSTIVISAQMNYIRNKNVGYNRENVIVMELDYNTRADVMVDALKSYHEISSVSIANCSPVNIKSIYFMRRGDQLEGTEINTSGSFIDEFFINSMQLKFISGENFTRQDVLNACAEDPQKREFSFIINESAAKHLGLTSRLAVGKEMFLGNRRGMIKGVVKDFHFASLHNPIEPLVLFPGQGYTMLVKVTGNNMQETISFLQKQWKIYSPGIPFEYKFLNEDFNLLYNSEARTMKIFFIFAAIAIFLACLGLFGLSAFSADQRIKEIGIRKTLGASTRNITVLLTTGFIKLVGISVIIATPLAWIGVSKWMQNFAYHIAIQWWMFALAGLIAILIAGLTISFHAIKTAIVNPVKSLRTE